MESFNAIPVFVTVLECGSFSAAAKKLGVSKAAVSKRVTQLEKQLGVTLLYRTTRKLSLTEAGERYFESAKRSVKHAKEAEDAVMQLQSAPQGRLRINAPMSFGRLHLAPLIPRFIQQYPDITIDLVMDDRVVDLIDGGFDVAIRAGNLPDSSLVARKLAPMHSILCASPAYLKKHTLPQTPEDLSQHNCLCYSYSGNEWTFILNGEPSAIQISGNYQVNNSEALREALLQGLGIARVPTFVVGPDITSGKLITLLDEYPLASLTLYALFPERQYLPKKVRVFIDFMVMNLGSDKPYWDQF